MGILTKAGVFRISLTKGKHQLHSPGYMIVYRFNDCVNRKFAIPIPQKIGPNKSLVSSFLRFNLGWFVENPSWVTASSISEPESLSNVGPFSTYIVSNRLGEVHVMSPHSSQKITKKQGWMWRIFHTIIWFHLFAGEGREQNYPKKDMRVFPRIGVGAQNRWFILETPIKIDHLEVPLFSETSMKCDQPSWNLFKRGWIFMFQTTLSKPTTAGIWLKLACRFQT